MACIKAVSGLHYAFKDVFSVQIEIKTKADTSDVGNLQKAADFLEAFILGELQGLRSLSKSPLSGWILMLQHTTGLTCLCWAGFDPADAIALLRLDDLYIECFEIKDVKVSLAFRVR